MEQLAAAAAPLAADRARRGELLPQAIAAACAERPGESAPGAPIDTSVAEQLAPAILEAWDAGDFVPAAVLAERPNQEADEQIVQEERSGVFVLNTARGVAHRLAITPLDVPEAATTSVCGWKCGGADGVAFPDASEVPAGYRTLCGKCFPRWRAIRKARETAVVGDLRC